MEIPLPPTTDCKVHFLTAKNINSTEIHRELCSVYGEDVMSRQMVSHWRQSFIEGSKGEREQHHTMNNNGHSYTSRTGTVVEDVQRIMNTDRCLTFDEILSQLSLNVEISRDSQTRII